MKTNQVIDVNAIFAAQMVRASEDKKGHRADKRESREAAAEKQIDAVEKNYEAAQKEISASIAKSWVQIATAPFGVVGQVAGGIINIGIDQTMGEEAALMRREAGMIDVEKERLRSLSEDQKSREEDDKKRAARAYDSGVRISETILNSSKLA